MSKRFLVTGGAGFLGGALVRRLLAAGHAVRILDNAFRGDPGRLADVAGGVDFVRGDIRDAVAVRKAVAGMEAVCHLAFINGTEHFYRNPELVLDVGVRGLVNVLDACRAEGVRELYLASSSEVYQTPPVIPTPEEVPLVVPDPHNPRYSYATGKIVSEVMALHAGPGVFDRVVIFRPHNVFGPAMGWEHVIPQFVVRMLELPKGADPRPFPVRGTGRETRSFFYIDDCAGAMLRVIERGEHRGIYHIGTREERTIASVAEAVGKCLGRAIVPTPGEPHAGSTPRRCPDVTKLEALGFASRVRFEEGLARTVRWYEENAGRRPAVEKRQ